MSVRLERSWHTEGPAGYRLKSSEIVITRRDRWHRPDLVRECATLCRGGQVALRARRHSDVQLIPARAESERPSRIAMRMPERSALKHVNDSPGHGHALPEVQHHGRHRFSRKIRDRTDVRPRGDVVSAYYKTWLVPSLCTSLRSRREHGKPAFARSASAGQPSPASVSEGWRPHRDSNPGFSLERAAS